MVVGMSLHAGSEANSTEVSRIQGVGKLGQQTYSSASEQKRRFDVVIHKALAANTMQIKQTDTGC